MNVVEGKEPWDYIRKSINVELENTFSDSSNEYHDSQFNV